MKQCNKCLENRNESEYKKDPRNKSGRTGICNVCMRSHYKKVRDSRMSQEIKVVTKECNKCLKIKDSKEFFKDRGMVDCLSTICKECKKENTYKWREENRDRYNETTRLYHAKHYQRLRIIRYKITTEQYDKMLLDQQGICAICSKPPGGKRPLCIDHDHETGKVRGLLCYGCNRALHILDKPVLLKKATDYISK